MVEDFVEQVKESTRNPCLTFSFGASNMLGKCHLH